MAIFCPGFADSRFYTNGLEDDFDYELLSKLDQQLSIQDVDQNSYVRDPDVQLMLRAKDGDDGAFEELVANNQDRLIGLFFHMVGDLATAEDLAQEAFLRVYRSRHTYEPTAKFSTWLFRITHNLASNARRSKGRRNEVALNVRDSGPLGIKPQEKLIADKSGLTPSRQLARSELQQIVHTALNDLNDRQRMAVLLHRFEGMSYQDIGLAMDLSTPAVKSLLSRARESLRGKLERYV